MNIQQYNTEKVAKYLTIEIDADCESALSGGKIYGKAMLNLKDTMDSLRIQIHGFSSYLVLSSESSKTPNLNANHEALVFEQKIDRMNAGQQHFEVDTMIPFDALSSLGIDGHDFGEFKNELVIKGVVTGSYLEKKPGVTIPPGAEFTAAQMARTVNNNRGGSNQNSSARVNGNNTSQSKLIPNAGAVADDKQKISESQIEGAEGKTIAMGIPVNQQEQKPALENAKGTKLEDNSPRVSVVNLSNNDVGISKFQQGESRSGPYFDEKFFVMTTTTEIEVDNDTDGHRVRLEKPVTRGFSTQVGSWCCKSNVTCTLQGFILNPNIRSYSDEIRCHAMLDMTGSGNSLQALILITAYGAIPKKDPRPDLCVWKALSSNIYYPDKALKKEDFNTQGNLTLIENHNPNASSFKGHFMTNTIKKPNSKAKNEFLFPHPDGNHFELYAKIKIGRLNGLGTFYSENKAFKTVYFLKVLPVIKGSKNNTGFAGKGEVGTHLSIPFSVKAKNEPTAEDLKALGLMYNGSDFEKFVPKDNLKKMENTMVQPTRLSTLKNPYNKVAPSG